MASSLLGARGGHLAGQAGAFGMKKEDGGMPYIGMILLVLQYAAVLFWLSQMVRVLTTTVEDFEDHKHKLLWFIVVVFVPLVGAIWFAVWRRQTIARRVQERRDAAIQEVAAAYQTKDGK